MFIILPFYSQQSRDPFMNVNTQGLSQNVNHWYHLRTERPDKTLWENIYKMPAKLWNKIPCTNETKYSKNLKPK